METQTETKKHTCVAYTKAEETVINKIFNKGGTPQEKLALSKKLDRKVTALAQKAYAMRMTAKEAKRKKKVGEVKVTHITKNISEKATITIGDAKVEIPSNTITIDGVKIGW